MDPFQAILDACSPDKTKSLLIGEFTTETGRQIDWSTIKDIQQAILEQAKLNMGWKCSGCGSGVHILVLRWAGHISCCPERKLEPPKTVGQGIDDIGECWRDFLLGDVEAGFEWALHPDLWNRSDYMTRFLVSAKERMKKLEDAMKDAAKALGNVEDPDGLRCSCILSKALDSK
jgi:hypothetical protein